MNPSADEQAFLNDLDKSRAKRDRLPQAVRRGSTSMRINRWNAASPFTSDQHPDLRADTATRGSAKFSQRSHLAGHLRSKGQLMANPPFNMSEWWDAKLEGDPRWKYGTPPKDNANFA